MFRRLIYRIGYPFALCYWFLFRPKTFGVKCVVECGGQVLFVRNSYGSRDQWTFPGGGVHRGEDPIAAAKREVLEEVGVVAHDPVFVGEYSHAQEYKRDTVMVYRVVVESQEISIQVSEILDAGWFEWGHLPSPLAPSVGKIIEMMDSV